MEKTRPRRHFQWQNIFLGGGGGEAHETAEV